jgi:hypothetical protein
VVYSVFAKREWNVSEYSVYDNSNQLSKCFVPDTLFSPVAHDGKVYTVTDMIKHATADMRDNWAHVLGDDKKVHVEI